jgi:hypothetical protein
LPTASLLSRTELRIWLRSEFRCSPFVLRAILPSSPSSVLLRRVLLFRVLGLPSALLPILVLPRIAVSSGWLLFRVLSRTKYSFGKDVDRSHSRQSLTARVPQRKPGCCRAPVFWYHTSRRSFRPEADTSSAGGASHRIGYETTFTRTIGGLAANGSCEACFEPDPVARATGRGCVGLRPERSPTYVVRKAVRVGHQFRPWATL